MNRQKTMIELICKRCGAPLELEVCEPVQSESYIATIPAGCFGRYKEDNTVLVCKYCGSRYHLYDL